MCLISLKFSRLDWDKYNIVKLDPDDNLNNAICTLLGKLEFIKLVIVA